MKKLLIALCIVAAAVVNIHLPVWAQDKEQNSDAQPAKDEQVIRGVIVSIDKSQNQIVIKHVTNGEKMTIVAPPQEMANLVAGDRVRVILKAGTNVATHIRKVIRR